MSQVEIELYSGRPNPVLTLSSADTAALQQRLDALQPADNTARPADVLGYRGLRVSGLGADIIVSAGVVEIQHDGGVRRLADPGRKLELWLVEAVALRMQQDELDFVRNELRR